MAKKYKRLTNKQKQFNKKIRQQLIAEGVIPPPKKRLNRKKYIKEAEIAFNDSTLIIGDLCLNEAISLMLGHKDRNFKTSLEAVGVAKTLRLAIRLQEFYEELRAKGEQQYKLNDKFNYIQGILEE